MQSKMINLIEKTRANGVFFISGDVHYGELSVQKTKNLYPIYDLTSSGITQVWDFDTDNKFRIRQAFHPNHYGLILIDWKAQKISLQLKDVEQKIVLQKNISFKKLE